jgi:hypothetical protein
MDVPSSAFAQIRRLLYSNTGTEQVLAVLMVEGKGAARVVTTTRNLGWISTRVYFEGNHSAHPEL